MSDSASLPAQLIAAQRAYRATEIAELVGLDVRTVRRAFQTGRLARANLDSWLRAWGSDVLAWIETSRRADPTAPPRETAILARVAAQVRREQQLEHTP